MSVNAQTTVSIVPPSTSIASSSSVSTFPPGSGGGRLATPSATRLRAFELGVGREHECPFLPCLELGELLLAAHPHGALEPVAGRDHPPAAEADADPDEPEDRVVRQRPREVRRPWKPVVEERH